MDEDKSIPETPVDNQADADAPLPETTEQVSAEENQKSDTSTDTSEAGSDEETQKESVDLKAWAKTRGLDVETETELKLAKQLRDTQSKVHETSQANKDLQATYDEIIDSYSSEDATEVSSLKQEVAKMKASQMISGFFQGTPDAAQYRVKMAEIAKDNPALANNLNDLYEVAKARSGNSSVDESKIRMEERTKLNQKQTASAPSTSASSQTPSKQTWTEAEIKKMDQDTYMENKDAIYAAYREGRVSA